MIRLLIRARHNVERGIEMNKSWRKRVAIGMLLGMLMVGAAGCQNSARTVTDETEYQGQDRKEDGDEVLEDNAVETLKDNTVVDKETNDKLEKIEEIVDNNFYFEGDEQAKQDGIIRGYMDSLGDPYSVYYTAEEFAGLLKNTEDDLESFGGVMFAYNDTNEIIAGIVYGPAIKAGIEVQDVLMKVNGEDITSWDIDTVMDKLRSEEGSEVMITIYRSSDGKAHDFTIPGQKVEIPTVEYKMLENHIGYVKVSRFHGMAYWQYVRAIQDLNSQEMEGLIVDIRDNSGGDLKITAMMLDYMLPEGEIFYTEDRDGNVTNTYNSTGGDQFDKPLAVLVNGNSASASEIFAGAIKDYGMGTIIGETTYGKGIAQNMFRFADGSAIKLTVSEFFTPNGNNIHLVGIEPDVEVKLDVEAYRESGGENDNQLQAAIDNIMGKMNK